MIEMSNAVYEIPLRQIDGGSTTLRAYAGKVLLIVNVASKCGLTPQYSALERLYESKRALGLEVLGFPANDFMGQEPGSDAEIKDFCSTQYDVKFPLFSKISVAGADQHPLYSHLVAAQPTATDGDAMREGLKGHGIKPNDAPGVLWNFEKFIVGRDGAVAARFAPSVAPDDARLSAAIDAALAKKIS
jgi:glutathione peroxidase